MFCHLVAFSPVVNHSACEMSMQLHKCLRWYFLMCNILAHELFTQLKPTDVCWPSNVTLQTEVTEHAENAMKTDENVI